jgi:hypothetical protein
MRSIRGMRVLLLTLAALGGTAVIASAAASAAEDPLWLFIVQGASGGFEPATPLPVGELEGPCGTTVDASGNFYVTDYYHDAIDVYQPEGAPDSNPPDFKVKYAYKEGERPPSGKEGYLTQIAGVDPIDGPCGLALDASGNLYVNDFHRSVVKYGSLSSGFGSGTVIAGQGVDSTHPTGVAVDQATGDVYVDARTYIAVYDSSGAPVLNGLEPLHIGISHIEDGYGVGVSSFPGTQGYLYVPDAGSDTVKVFNPAVSKVNPIGEIDGSETALGKFISLRDSSVAIDRVSGEVYVVDNLHPKHAERPEAIVYVFDSGGTYEGHLLDRVVDNLPVGLAVDNSPSARYPVGTQGLVYVTTGNTARGAIYNYTPGAATMAEPGPAAASIKLSVSGSGEGSVQSSVRGRTCQSTCEESVPAGATVDLTASPGDGSSFSGWSGACAGADPVCSIQVEKAASVAAGFTRDSGSGPAAAGAPASGQAAPPRPSPRAHHRRHHHRHAHHRGHRHR